MSHLELFYETAGDGVPVVFTHGWLNTSEVWSGVVDHLDGQVRSLTWDLRGHGRSGIAPAGQYGREYALADLRRVVDVVGRPAVLVGHSLGGYLSLAQAVLEPDSVAGLVLVAAGPGFRNEDSRNQWNDAVAATAAGTDIPDGQEEISKHVDSLVLDKLSTVTAPTVTLVGDRDKRFLASADVFDKYLDVRERITVPDAGHMVHAKKPEVVGDAVLAIAQAVA
jgi:pimeloyl-ACP methyl ester carboxylesterase